MQNFLQSNLFKGIIIGLGCLIVLTFVFSLGVSVGMKRANFAFQWADQYHHNFGGPQGGFLGDFPVMMNNNEFSNANGSYGQIIGISNNVLTVKDNDGDNTEKNILVGDKTTIILQRKNIKLADLKIGENIVTIGDPNSSGEIQAELIRVMPARPVPSTMPSTTPTPKATPTPTN